MGNPQDDPFFYEGWRDTGQGEPRPRDVIHDPTCAPVSSDPRRQQELQDYFCRLRDELKKAVFFVKRPAFVEPPFFAKPIIKVKCGLQVAGGATGLIFDRLIEERQRAIVVAFGLDLAPIAPLFNCQLEFWFQRATGDGGTGVSQAEVIPLFDDQTPTTYGGSTPVRTGRTTSLPGSLENPWCLLSNGLQWGIHGRSRLQMLVENKSGVTVTIRGILAYYQYWSSAGASEFESGDMQV